MYITMHFHMHITNCVQLCKLHNYVYSSAHQSQGQELYAMPDINLSLMIIY